MATPIINTNLGKVVNATGDIAADLSTLRPLLRNAIFSAYPTDSLSNTPIASFPDGADNVPMKSATFAIQPVQDLHGYDSPWPAGGGKNISPTKSGSSDANGRLLVSDIGTIIEGQTYTVSLKALEVNAKEVRVQIDSNNQGAFNASTFVVGQRVSTTFTANASGTLRLNTNNAAFSASTNVVDDIQLELGSTATDYAPYSNECPISGFTGAEVTRAGKNLLDDTEFRKFSNWSTNLVNYPSFPTTTDAGYKLPCVSGKTYTISFEFSGVPAYFYLCRASGRTSERLCSFTTTQVNYTKYTFTAESGWFYYLRISAGAESSFAERMSHIASEQLEEGSTATDIVQSATTIPITWQDEAGTVYGGTLEYLGGDAWRLTKTMASGPMSGLTYSYDTTSLDVPVFYSSSISGRKAGSDNMLCSIYKNLYNRSDLNDADFAISTWNRSSSTHIGVRDSRYTDAATFTAAMSSVQLVYELATPVVYDLTGDELATVLGNNNVFSNTGDVTELVYRADTALYIEKKLAE